MKTQVFINDSSQLPCRQQVESQTCSFDWVGRLGFLQCRESEYSPYQTINE